MSYEVDSKKTIPITEDIFKMLPVVRPVSLLVIIITVYIFWVSNWDAMIPLEETHQPLYALHALLYSPCKVVFFYPSSAVVEAITGYHRL